MRLHLAVISLLLAPLLPAQFAERAHPRLWMDEAHQRQVELRIQRDPLAKAMQQAILREADEILRRRTTEHVIHDGRRLLRESRLALHQILHCAWAWRFTGERKYLERGMHELEAACAMKDWNPSHFLDTAEMALAVALGYDWFHPALTPDQKRMCETSIRDKALRPARKLIDTNIWWNEARNNWAQVCGSGIGLAAIAVQIAGDELSSGLIRDCSDLLSRCNHFYQPDGLYPEGPGYWHYGTNYHVMFAAAVAALGDEAPIPDRLEQSGTCMIHLHGPTRIPFNFSDGKAQVSGKSPAQAWIASHFDNAAQSRDCRQVIARCLDPEDQTLSFRSSPLSLLWLPEKVESAEPLALHAVLRGEQSAAIFRTSWDNRAIWLAIKGGTPLGGHGHMDVGSFCYDAHGMRWIHDLGGDNYNMPGYFREERFTYYRLQNRSHNTLEINGGLQDADCKPCPITDSSTERKPFVILDLSKAYADDAKRVIRRADFNPRTGVTRIRDDITLPEGEVIWRVITDAECEIDGDQVTLRKQGKSIRLQRHGEVGTWSVTEAKPPLEIENDNRDYRDLRLTLPAADSLTIEVEITP